MCAYLAPHFVLIQIHKMTPIFTQNNNLSENSCHFCEFAQFSKQSFARLKSKHLAQFFW